MRLWNLRQSSGLPIVLSGHKDLVGLVRFAPDGIHLASASNDATIRVWDTAHPQNPPLTLSGLEHGVRSLAFDSAGDLLAFAQDQTVRIWDLRRPYALPLVLAEHEAAVRAVGVSRDGEHVYSYSGDGVIRISPLWSAVASYVCTRVWRNLSLQEWRTYIGPEIPYQKTCPNLPAGAGAASVK